MFMLAGIGAGVVFLLLMFLIASSYRVVVSTNDVHIVQTGTKTVSYGKDKPAGNAYYAWPSWMPIIGIKVIKLPVSVFSVELESYAAYDKGRVPFVIDIMAFFRIEDSDQAAQRVHSFDELKEQLEGILQGASRSILAQSPIEEILEERAKYGEEFTKATNNQLEAWGVANVKNIELMDIRDTKESKVIQNIMAMKQSTIEMESRTTVANNMQKAQTAEIQAQQNVAITKQEAEELVGVRTAAKEQKIGIAAQQAQQNVAEQQKVTAEKSMAVLQVNQVRGAEIQRDVEVVKAQQEKQVAIVTAEGEKQRAITIAEGTLQQAKLAAEGTEAKGLAEGAAQQAILMAPVNAQVSLAKEIGSNEGYQAYLVKIEQIKAGQAVGIEQAKALAHADVKVVSNVGNPSEGLTSVMDLFSVKGATQLGAALEAISNTPTGRAITEKLGVTKPNGSSPATNGAARA